MYLSFLYLEWQCKNAMLGQIFSLTLGTVSGLILFTEKKKSEELAAKVKNGSLASVWVATKHWSVKSFP
jgi:hypothetical protein